MPKQLLTYALAIPICISAISIAFRYLIIQIPLPIQSIYLAVSVSILLYMPFVYTFTINYLYLRNIASKADIIKALTIGFLINNLATFTANLILRDQALKTSWYYVISILGSTTVLVTVIWLTIEGLYRIAQTPRERLQQQKWSITLLVLLSSIPLTLYAGSVFNNVIAEHNQQNAHWYIHRGIPFAWNGYVKNSTQVSFPYMRIENINHPHQIYSKLIYLPNLVFSWVVVIAALIPTITFLHTIKIHKLMLFILVPVYVLALLYATDVWSLAD